MTILIIILWLAMGFMGRCLMKNWFVQRFAITSTWLTKDEAWGTLGEALGIFLFIIGPLGLITASFCVLTSVSRNPNTDKKIPKWKLML